MDMDTADTCAHLPPSVVIFGGGGGGGGSAPPAGGAFFFEAALPADAFFFAAKIFVSTAAKAGTCVLFLYGFCHGRQLTLEVISGTD